MRGAAHARSWALTGIYRQRRSQRHALKHWHDSTTCSLAAFPVALRRVYATARKNYPDSVGVPAFLTSPSILLLPSAWRIQLALYVATSALVAVKKPSWLERTLPPVWTLNCLGNAILIMLFLTEENAVQASYEGIVIDVRMHVHPRSPLLIPCSIPLVTFPVG